MEDFKFIALMGDKSANFTITTSSENLRAFADYLIDKAREELAARQAEEAIEKENAETFLSRKETCEYLGVCEATLWKWAKPERRYLMPVRVGNKVRYRKSDLDRIKFGNTPTAQ